MQDRSLHPRQNGHNQKIQKQQGLERVWRKRNLSTLSVDTATMEGRMEIPVKTKNKTTYDLAIPFLGVYPEEKTEKRHMHPSVHCSTIYNNQDMKATYTSTNR